MLCWTSSKMEASDWSKFVCYTYLAATTIFLNVIERKYKRQIFPPDPIILVYTS